MASSPVEKVGLDLEAARVRQQMKEEQTSQDVQQSPPKDTTTAVPPADASASTSGTLGIPPHKRTNIVIVGLGMVAIAFMCVYFV
jgi:hypothetical protein